MDGRLYRSRRDRMLAGVAGGLAELWGADPSLVRIVWALLVLFTGGLALIVYLVMAVVVPEEDDAWLGPPASGPSMPGFGAPDAPTAPGTPAPTGTGPDAQAWAAAEAADRAAWAERRAARSARRAAHGHGRGSANGALLGGTLLILVGVFFLAREYLPTIDFDWFWPLVLVGFGVLLLVTALRRDGRPGGPDGSGGAA